VQQGDEVEFEVVSGRAHIRAVGIAAHDADIGEMVQAKNPMNGNGLSGRVVASGKALVH
jgi:flagella basal body P-ring formation protein FlgA